MVGAPLFEIDYRPTEDLIRTKITGFWRPADADAYFAKLIPVMTQLRLRDGRAKVLADRRGGVPQSAETLSRTLYWYDRAYLPGDMSAVVVDTSLLKLQLKRVYPPDRANIFISYNAAETWLRAK